MIKKLIETIPGQLKNRSGSVFYSGVDAFSGEKHLYVLGLNPGGAPEAHANETIEFSIKHVLENEPKNWSAYRDESWEGAPPGTWRMQPRVLHLFRKLNLDPGEVPSSNLIFVTSRRENNINNEVKALCQECWLFHEAVIKELRPNVILCFGKTVGKYLREKLDANIMIDEFVEANNRRWRSQAFSGKNGVNVIVVTHPSVADWTTPEADPSEMIRRVVNSDT